MRSLGKKEPFSLKKRAPRPVGLFLKQKKPGCRRMYPYHSSAARQSSNQEEDPLLSVLSSRRVWLYRDWCFNVLKNITAVRVNHRTAFLDVAMSAVVDRFPPFHCSVPILHHLLEHYLKRCHTRIYRLWKFMQIIHHKLIYWFSLNSFGQLNIMTQDVMFFDMPYLRIIYNKVTNISDQPRTYRWKINLLVTCDMQYWCKIYLLRSERM